MTNKVDKRNKEGKQAAAQAYEDRRLLLEQFARYGDNKLVSELTGFSEDYVSKVLTGKRKSEKILDAYAQIIDNRREMMRTQLDQMQRSR